MKYAFLLFFILFGVFQSVAQPTIEWQRSYGGTDYDDSRSIQQTTDGGYIVAGVTLSNNWDVSGNHGVNDFWVVKLDAVGTLQWQRTYGGSNHDWAYAIQQTTDGGYIVVGQTESSDGDVSGHHGDKDFWVLKLNSLGDIHWQKTLGGSSYDRAEGVQQTFDGGYIVVGSTTSADGDVTEKKGGLDFWVVKLDTDGNLEWQKSLGGTLNEIAYSVQQTADGGYVVAGNTDSYDGDVTGQHGGSDFWIVKLNSLGNLEWQKTLGGNSIDSATEICITSDGGYVVFGVGSSNNGDMTGHQGGYDYWVVKLDATGNLEWQKSFGGSGEDWGKSIKQTKDGGYILFGSSQSNDGDVVGNHGGQDSWLLKLDSAGELIWQRALGGTKAEVGSYVQQTHDGGFILTGRSQSNDGDASFNRGSSDYWVVKLSPEITSPTLSPSAHTPLDLYPNPASQSITVQIPGDLDETRLSVRITDLLGREILQRACNNGESLDLAQLPNGMFLLSATSASGKVFFGKFRKQE